MEDDARAAATKDKAYLSGRGWTFTYDVELGDVYTLSAVSGDGSRILYYEVFVGDSYMNTMHWDYPSAGKVLMDPVVERAAATFTPGPL